MRFSGAAAAIVVSIMATAPAVAQSAWQGVRDADYRIAGEMPGPAPRRNGLAPEGATAIEFSVSDVAGVYYALTAMRFANPPSAPAETLLQSAMASQLTRNGGTVLQQSTLVVSGQPAVDYTAALPGDAKMRIRLTYASGVLYQAIVVGAVVDTPTADRVIGSLKVTD